MAECGKYIVLEGLDGTGKSSQVKPLRDRLYREKGIESVEFHEPDGVDMASAIRTILKDGSLERDAITNLLLFTSARHENWRRLGQSALQNGLWLVTARSWRSTTVYQGDGEGLDKDLIEKTTRTFVGDDYMSPNLELILLLNDELERQKRIEKRGPLENPDTFESRGADFQAKLNMGYRALALAEGLPTIVADGTFEEVHELIWEETVTRLGL